MAIPNWILESPLKAGIATMEAGGRLGLAARSEDLRAAAQADAAAEASDRLSLSMQEMQARREQAAAQLAESLRQHNAMEQYRQSEVANQQAIREQSKQSLAAQLLRQGQQQQNWTADHALRSAAEQRLEDKATEAENFTPGNAEDITLSDGAVVGHRWQRSPRVWESVKEPKNKGAAELSPTARVNALLRIASASPHISAMDTTSPLYPGATNALARANELLSAPVASKAIVGKRLKWNPETKDFE